MPGFMRGLPYPGGAAATVGPVVQKSKPGPEGNDGLG